MKKLIALLLVAAFAVSCMACGLENNDGAQNNQGTESGNQSENGTDTETEVQPQITDANEILAKVWETYQEDEKFVAVGGHYESYTDGGPAKYDITKTQDMEVSFCIPLESIDMVDDVASLQHGMKVTNFTAAAYHLKNSADMQILVDDITNMTMNNQWLGGIPERFVVITVGNEYVVSAFGSGEIVDNFKSKLLGLYDNIPALVVSEDI